VRERFHVAMPHHQFTQRYFDYISLRGAKGWPVEGRKLWEVTRTIIPVSFGPSLFYITNASPEPRLRWLSPHRKWLVFAVAPYAYDRHVMAVKHGMVYNYVRRGISMDLPLTMAQEVIPQTHKIELISPVV
jgi:hypothetical protein